MDTSKSLKNASDCFDKLYTGIRSKEHRIYTDEQLKRLPQIDPKHVHAREWKIRQASAARLTRYLTKKQRALKVLEIGCGNGWLAAKIAAIAGTEVLGIDVNELEMEQARRVFKKKNLQFRTGQFEPEDFVGIKFDVVIFAASLQYFSSLESIWGKVRQCLGPGGEIHVLDTKFYLQTELAAARERTAFYFEQKGYPEMASFYFHHTWDELSGFNHRILFNPNHLLNRIYKKSPFFWICINC